ncbi:MAG TPA: hypothetical protein VFU86_00735 [Terriglobales bacterium]|nr:hypothetical protein [Terriglobales bacterium]
MTKKDLESALEAERRSHWRALQKLDVRHHATNLLINDLVEWFSTRQTPDGNTHQFGIGVVMNADKPAVVDAQGQRENVPIVFVMTTMLTQSGPIRNLTVHELNDFRSLPEVLSSVSTRKSDADLATLIRDVTPLVDQAYAEYLRGRIRTVPPLKRVR